MTKITLEQYREHVRSLDWRAVYGDLYPDYDPQDEEYFARCTEQDYDDGPDAWAFIDIKEN